LDPYAVLRLGDIKMTETKKTIYIKFFAVVNGNSANTLMQLVDQYVSQGFQRIVLLISSPGGTVFHGLSQKSEQN
jgi:ATP-dependent protease ClpP protease subunit